MLFNLGARGQVWIGEIINIVDKYLKQHCQKPELQNKLPIKFPQLESILSFYLYSSFVNFIFYTKFFELSVNFIKC